MADTQNKYGKRSAAEGVSRVCSGEALNAALRILGTPCSGNKECVSCVL